MNRPAILFFLLLGLGACTAGEKPDEKKPRPASPATGAAVAEARRAAKEIKEMVVPTLPAGQTLTIDGKLDEAAWQKAASSGEFVDVGTGVVNPRLPVQGQVRLLWDDSFLYVGFEVKDMSIRGGFPTDAKDPHLWERDTVEIMIDPDGDGDNKNYYEIQINPQNLVFDSQFDDYNQPRGGPAGPFGHQEWMANQESAVVLRGKIDDDREKDDGYVVEAKIPWVSFSKANKVPPEPGTFWRMNFYAMENNGGVAWSPILGMGNFHKAARFGRVKWQRDVAP
jgi:Carbohydrate family 9 binding domain-like